MPALVTHYLHALDVFEALKKTDISVDKDAFLLGAQGPDPLYFHRALPVFQPGKSCRNIGTMLHQQMGNELFSHFAKYLSTHEFDAAAYSYAMGFLCHYSLDRTCHPYVYATEKAIIEQENVKYSRSFIHSRIEHSLDVIILRAKTEMLGNDFDPGICVPNEKKLTESVAKMLKFVIDNCSQDCEVSEKQIIQAINDTHFLQHFSRDRTGLKHAAVRGLEMIAFQPPCLSTFIRTMMEDDKWDYSNYQKNEWKNPFDEAAVSTKQSFFELFDQSVDDSLILIKRFALLVKQNEEIVDFTGNLSFKTGLPITHPETEE